MKTMVENCAPYVLNLRNAKKDIGSEGPSKNPLSFIQIMYYLIYPRAIKML